MFLSYILCELLSVKHYNPLKYIVRKIKRDRFDI